MHTSDRPITVGAEPFGGPLTNRERFRRVMHYQTVDRIPHMEFGYWTSLKDRWMDEGHLPESMKPADGGVIPDGDVEGFFGCEFRIILGQGIDAGPGRPTEIVDNTGDRVIYRDGLGVLCEEVKEGIRTIPHYLEFPIKDRATWERFRDEFLVPDAPWRGKTEAQLDALAAKHNRCDTPVGVNFGSFIGRIRNWVGFENLAYMSHDDPDLVEDMVEHVTGLMLRYLPPLLDRVEFDFAHGWEDICFNSGPLLSPKFFTERIIPYMQPVMQLLRRHGIDIVFTDTDGNIEALVPLWMDIGMNAIFPVEIKPGQDVVRFREEYGPDLLILGGFDKLVLFESKEAVLAEFKRLEPVIAQGGFIPHIDHRCPDGVDYEMYQYYIHEKCHFLGMTDEEIGRIPGLKINSATD